MNRLLILLLPLALFAGSIENAKDLLKGHLTNGMAYYIHKNGYPKDSVEIKLVVKAGSLDEKPDERGLAHFVEHMVFRGTRNFKDYEIKNFIDSLGGQFGHHTNAMTSFDTTEYHLTLPKSNEQNLQKGLSILNEMMFEAKFDADLLEKERGIVLSEKSMQDERMVSLILKQFSFLGQEHLSQRLPIGQEKLIKTVTSEKMRKFYHRQYRPGKMAIIISGNIDPEETQKKVQSIFTKKVAPLLDAKMDRPLCHLQQPQVLVNIDSKIGANCVTLVKQIPVQRGFSFQDDLIKRDFIKSFCGSYLTQRLTLKVKEGRSYLMPSLTSGSFSNDNQFQFFNFCYNKDGLLEATKQYLEDLNVILNSPIDEISFNTFLEAQISNCQQEIINNHLIAHTVWVQRCRDDFIFKRGTQAFLDQNQAIIRNAKLCTISDAKEYLIQLKNTLASANHILLNSTDKQDSSVQELIDVVETSRSQKIHCQDQVRKKKDLIVELAPAKERELVWEKGISGCFEAKLKNGLQVIFHPLDESKQKARFMLLAKNGTNAVKANLLPSAHLATSVAGDSGLANLDDLDFNTYLQEKGIELGACASGCCGAMKSYYQLSTLSKTVQGTFKVESLPQAMKVLYALFNHKQFDQKTFDLAVKNLHSAEESYKDNDYMLYNKWYQKLLYKDHPLFQEIKAKNADYDNAKKIFQDAFVNPSEFTLVISGDLTKKALEEALLTYISPLEDKTVCVEPIHSTDLDLTSGDHTYYHESKQGSFGQCLIPMKKTPVIGKRMLGMDLLSKIITERLFQALRLDQAKSYGQYAVFTPLTGDWESLTLMLEFIADDKDVSNMHELTFKMIQDLCRDGVTFQEVVAAKKKLLEIINLEEQDPFRFITFHTRRIMFDYSQQELLNRKAYVSDRISVSDLNDIIAEIDTGQMLKISKVLK